MASLCRQALAASLLVLLPLAACSTHRATGESSEHQAPVVVQEVHPTLRATQGTQPTQAPSSASDAQASESKGTPPPPAQEEGPDLPPPGASLPSQAPASSQQASQSTTHSTPVPPAQAVPTPASPVQGSSAPPVSPETTVVVEAQLVELVNAERAKAGLPPLTRDDTLDRSALAWSEHMAYEGFRNDPEVTKGAPAGWRLMGENIAYTDVKPAAPRVLQLWMGAPTHRANILNPTFTRLGLGITCEQGICYANAVFWG